MSNAASVWPELASCERPAGKYNCTLLTILSVTSGVGARFREEDSEIDAMWLRSALEVRGY
jgi:hypothetical protein